MQPRFLYFDMGNVLLPFSHQRMAEQMARVAGTQPQTAWRILFEDGLHWAYERGEFSRAQFYSRFCEAAKVPLADLEALDTAGNDIFELNAPIIGLVGKLRAAGYPLGVLSNTSASHWAHCTSRFGALTTVFDVHALSYQFHAMKPAAEVYAAAEKLAGVPANRIFFTDDRPENVAAATTAGWDAVLYESVSQLNEALRHRGVILNY
jgi:glucose-1-phosphatase